MKTYSLSRLPIGSAVGRVEGTGPEGLGTANPSTPGRAEIRVDGLVYRGPTDIAAFYFRRWSAEHPEKNVTIEEDA